MDYKGGHINVCIICPEHGEFYQSPSNHLSGKGCLYCGGTSGMDKTLFILKAKEIHGDKYDYTNVEYINSHTKVKIICPIHGEFMQPPQEHINGQGCPKCNQSKGERMIEKYLRGREYMDLAEGGVASMFRERPGYAEGGVSDFELFKNAVLAANQGSFGGNMERLYNEYNYHECK